MQNILNDAQGAMGASAQTTLTTEYVMLKDTSGIYHKILKSSFTEAIRDVLAGLLVNNDKGTTINQIAAIASGDFGSITPANLASVLGVAYNKELVANTDILQLSEGNYHTGSGAVVRSLSNAPSGADGECYIEARVIYNSGEYMYYMFFDRPSGKMFYAARANSTATTLVWKEIATV